MYNVIKKHKNNNEPRREKTCIRGFRHKPGCTTTDDGRRLNILDLIRRIIALFGENKGADPGALISCAVTKALISLLLS